MNSQIGVNCTNVYFMVKTESGTVIEHLLVLNTPDGNTVYFHVGDHFVSFGFHDS